MNCSKILFLCASGMAAMQAGWLHGGNMVLTGISDSPLRGGVASVSSTGWGEGLG